MAKLGLKFMLCSYVATMIINYSSYYSYIYNLNSFSSFMFSFSQSSCHKLLWRVMLVSRALYARSKALGLATIVGSLSALNPALVLLSRIVGLLLTIRDSKLENSNMHEHVLPL